MKTLLLKTASPVRHSPLAEHNTRLPHYGKREILLKVHVCGICHTDLHTVEGDIFPAKMPIIPGHQIIGTVVRTGDQVKRFRKGDRVGVAWLRYTCGVCKYCLSGRENLCGKAQVTGL